MKLIRDINSQVKQSCAVALGAFDGLHLGHQELIKCATNLSACVSNGLCSVVCFEPLPRQYFQRDGAIVRLSTASERLSILKSLGVDQCLQLRFNASLAAMKAEDFVYRVLVGALSASHVVVGDDFRFGAGRFGNAELLAEMGLRLDFQVHTVKPVIVAGERISSTRIRSALASGNIAQARRLLGRPFQKTGRVRRGQQLGRDLGYPTANIAFPSNSKPPLTGIYAVRVRLHSAHTERVPVASAAGFEKMPVAAASAESKLQAFNSGQWLDAVASLGQRPTVNQGEPLLEVHLFDFCGDLYGRKIDVEFVQKLRDEAHFATVTEMVEQIHDDAAQARQILRQG